MSLLGSLASEINRVCGIMAKYDKIPTGFFAAILMRRDINEAIEALYIGDTVGMLTAYEALKGWEL